MSLNIKDNLHLVSEKLDKGQLKTCLGFQQMSRQNNHMMNQCLKESIKIISVLLGFTVLKQYVHHVGLLLPGQNFQKLNHLPIFWHFWKMCFTLKSPDQITFALIKHAWYFEQLSEMDHGKRHGKRQLNLLLMLIITSTIKMMMNFAKNGVILHQLMVLHLIWLLKLKIKREKLVSDVHSIHR